MKLLLLEQKYLELIEDGHEVDAWQCLRTEITPLNFNSEKLIVICR